MEPADTTLGPIGLILPTFAQDTVPAWAETPGPARAAVDPLVELAGR